MWNYAEVDGEGFATTQNPARFAALGTVRMVDGALLTVDLVAAGGAATLVTLPAVHHAPYAPGNRVLAIFQGDDPASGVIVGRIDMPDDAFTAADYLRTDGSAPLTSPWDVGADAHIALAELRARDAGGLRLSDAAGLPALIVADGGAVGIGAQTPQGILHLWDGVGGNLFATITGINATAQPLIAAGAESIAQIVRVDALVSNGTARTFLGFTLTVGGITTQNLSTGGDTWQFRLNLDGSLDLRRTAGSGTGTALVRAMWL